MIQSPSREPDPFAEEYFCGPQAYIPGNQELYVVNKPEYLRPAIAFVSELCGIKPAPTLGKVVSCFQLSTRSSQTELNSAAGLFTAEEYAEHNLRLQAMAEELLPDGLGMEYLTALPPPEVWPLLSGSILAATDPDFPSTQEVSLVKALSVTLPAGTPVDPVEPSPANKKALLREYGDETVRHSAICLGNELFMQASLRAVIDAVLKFRVKTTASPEMQKGIQEFAIVINTLSAPLTRSESSSLKAKQVGSLICKIRSDLQQLSESQFDVDTERTTLTSTIKSTKFFMNIVNATHARARSRQETQKEAKNELLCVYAEIALDEYAQLEKPYTFASNKELRNSPYWQLCAMMTGHGKHELLQEPLDQTTAVEVVGALARAVTYLRECSNDPDAALERIELDLAKEKELAETHQKNRNMASLGMIPPARLGRIGQRLQTLQALWPKLRPGIEKIITPNFISMTQFDELDVLFAVMKP